MTETSGADARYRGACVFGTASGLTIRGVGCLQEASRGLLRILDFGTQKLQRGETAWFVLPYAIGGDHGKLIGQVGFASDFKGREGFAGVGVAVTEHALLRTGYSGPVYLIERLFPWFLQNFDAVQGDATFAQADQVLASFAVPPAQPAEVHQDEALRLKLPNGWQNHISPPELMGILPGYVQYAEIMRRGYVLRMSERAQCDKDISEDFLSTWRQELYGPKERQVLELERARLSDALNQTVEAYKAQDRFATALKSDLDGKILAIGSLEGRVRAEADARSRLTQELQAKKSEAEAALQAKTKLEAEQDRLKVQLGDTQRRLTDAIKANETLLPEYRANQARLAELDEKLRTAHESAMSDARREVAEEKRQLVDRIAEQERVLGVAGDSIKELQAKNHDLEVEFANAQVTIAGSREPDALPPEPRGNTGGGGHGPRSGSWEGKFPPQNNKKKPLGPVVDPAGGGHTLPTFFVICIAAAALSFVAYANISGLPFPRAPGNGGNIDGAGALANENHILREKMVNMEKNMEKEVVKAHSEAQLRLQLEIDGYKAKEQMLRAETEKAKTEATRSNEAALNALKEMEKLKTRSPATASPGLGPVTPSAGPGSTPSKLPTAPVATLVSSPPVPLNQRCGTDPAYRTTVDFAKHCSAGSNWRTPECQSREKIGDFPKLAVEIANCQKALSFCGPQINSVQKSDNDRRIQGWYWHGPLAVAMDSVLVCIVEAWKKVPAE